MKNIFVLIFSALSSLAQADLKTGCDDKCQFEATVLQNYRSPLQSRFKVAEALRAIDQLVFDTFNSEYEVVWREGLNILGLPAKMFTYHHIRLKAIRAILQIAQRSNNTAVKSKALEVLRPPVSSQIFEVRVAAIEAVRTIAVNSPNTNISQFALVILNDVQETWNNEVWDIAQLAKSDIIQSKKIN